MESDPTDSLEFVPREQWVHLEKTFLADWPRGIPSYNALVTQRRLSELGLDYGFKVYRPRGHFTNGMVALNKKADFNEIIIQCPHEDTAILEEALLATNVIDWSKDIIVPFLSEHMLECIQRVAKKLNKEFDDARNHAPHYIVHFSKDNPPFENISMPDGVEFRNLTEDHVDLIDSVWPNRYKSSPWLFKYLIKLNSGYGIFKNDELAAWVFVNDIGSLTHLFTLEAHRKKGYAKILLQHVCNLCIKEGKDVYACCLDVNNSALKLYEGLGFQKLHPVRWMYLLPK